MKIYKNLMICFICLFDAVQDAVKPAIIITILLILLSAAGCRTLSWPHILFGPLFLLSILNILKTVFFILLHKVADRMDRRCR